MNRLGILFAGQGAQHVHMGVGWTASDPVAGRTLQEASRILGYDSAELLSSSDGRLDETIFAQTKKLDALKTHKKGLMQQLFPFPEEAL